MQGLAAPQRGHPGLIREIGQYLVPTIPTTRFAVGDASDVGGAWLALLRRLGSHSALRGVLDEAATRMRMATALVSSS